MTTVCVNFILKGVDVGSLAECNVAHIIRIDQTWNIPNF